MATFQKVKLGDITEIVSGGTPDSSNLDYWGNGNINWATLPDLHHKYLLDTHRKITELGLKNSSAKLLPVNTVIFSSRATIGEVSIAKVPTSTNQGSKNFICDPSKVNFEYLYYSLKFNAKKIEQLATGATYKEINKTDFSNVEIALPDLPTQSRIASVLSAYDDLIENNEKRIKALEEMASRLYTEWFVKFKSPGNEKVQMVDSGTEFGMIPEGWEVKIFGDVVNVQYGYTASAEENNDYPKYLRGMDINKRSFIDWKDVPNCKISEQDFKKYKIRKGDVFIIRMADPGKIGICEREVNAVFASYLMRLSIKKDVTPYYLYYFVTSERYQGFVLGASGGTTRKSINSQQVIAINVLIPECDVLESFESKVGLFREELTKLIQQNNSLSKTRDLLIPQLVTGRQELK